jgi:hypothetical protein
MPVASVDKQNAVCRASRAQDLTTAAKEAPTSSTERAMVPRSSGSPSASGLDESTADRSGTSSRPSGSSPHAVRMGAFIVGGNEDAGEQLCWQGRAGATFKETCPVGSFLNGASPFGALDMAGNVAEWTSTAETETEGGGGFRTRGGSYQIEQIDLASRDTLMIRADQWESFSGRDANPKLGVGSLARANERHTQVSVSIDTPAAGASRWRGNALARAMCALAVRTARRSASSRACSRTARSFRVPSTGFRSDSAERFAE